MNVVGQFIEASQGQLISSHCRPGPKVPFGIRRISTFRRPDSNQRINYHPWHSRQFLHFWLIHSSLFHFQVHSSSGHSIPLSQNLNHPNQDSLTHRLNLSCSRFFNSSIFKNEKKKLIEKNLNTFWPINRSMHAPNLTGSRRNPSVRSSLSTPSRRSDVLKHLGRLSGQIKKRFIKQ